MIYKFEDGLDCMEVTIEEDIKKCKFLISDNDGTEWTYFYLDATQLFKLIGALHLIQKELK